MELKILRIAARLTQKQLADISGVDDSTISLVENGQRDIGGMAYYSVVRIRRALAPGLDTEKVFPVPHLEPDESSRPT